jgi:cobalt-zinc-cadmium efflux system outer membrane protein
MRLDFRLAAASLCALFIVADGQAQSVPEPLKLEDAIRRALERQPELQGFVFSLRAQAARIEQAALPPVAQAEVLIEDAAGSGERSGFDAAQTTLSLSRVIELGGKREGRIAVAEAVQARLQTEQAARQLDVTAEVARRFVDALHEREILRIADESVQLAERTQAAVGRRVQAALAPAAESARADVQVAQARLDLEHAGHQLESSRRFLAAAMGERDVRFGEVTGELFGLPHVPAEGELLRQIEASPDFLRFAAEVRVRDAEVRLAEVQRRVDVRGQFGIRRYEDEGDFAIVAGISVPLNAPRRARPAIEAARAERALTDAEREAAFLRVRAQLLAQYRELQHLRLEAGILRETIIPKLQNALERTELAYQRGRYSYLEWTEAQQALLDARRRLVDVAGSFHTVWIEIERLAGRTLESSGVTP